MRPLPQLQLTDVSLEQAGASVSCDQPTSPSATEHPRDGDKPRGPAGAGARGGCGVSCADLRRMAERACARSPAGPALICCLRSLPSAPLQQAAHTRAMLSQAEHLLVFPSLTWPPSTRLSRQARGKSETCCCCSAPCPVHPGPVLRSSLGTSLVV